MLLLFRLMLLFLRFAAAVAASVDIDAVLVDVV